MDILYELTCAQMFGKYCYQKNAKDNCKLERHQTQLNTKKGDLVTCLAYAGLSQWGGVDGIGAEQTNWRRKTIEIERYAMTARAARNSLDKQKAKNLSKALLPANTDLRQRSHLLLLLLLLLPSLASHSTTFTSLVFLSHLRQCSRCLFALSRG